MQKRYYFSRHYFLLVAAAILLSACGFQFQNKQFIPPIFHNLVLVSNDGHTNMSRIMREHLVRSGIKIVQPTENFPVLKLQQVGIGSQVASVFRYGREAEKILSLTLQASISIPQRGEFPITVNITRTFFDDSRAALAKASEQETIYNDMREEAARQVIIKMVSLEKQLNSK